MEPNIGWLFYKDFYNNLLKTTVKYAQNNKQKKHSNLSEVITNINWEFLRTTSDQKKGIQEKNALFLSKKAEAIEKYIFTTVNKDGQNILDLEVPHDQKFSLTTIYPGLLIGSGYQHESHAQGEYKLGFFFDHTTGLPVIPGSSVKGVLRNVFKNRRDFIVWLLNKKTIGGKLIQINIIGSRQDIATELLNPDYIKLIEDLEKEIFEGIDGDGNLMNIYKRDIFHDAFIIRSKEHQGRFMASDYITPHKHPNDHSLDQFANPTPIMFLKILPGVEFGFQFSLHDGLITSKDKIELFKNIIQQSGIGAKTNIGYGQFE